LFCYFFVIFDALDEFRAAFRKPRSCGIIRWRKSVVKKLLCRAIFIAHVHFLEDFYLLSLALALKALKNPPEISRNDFTIVAASHFWRFPHRRGDPSVPPVSPLAIPYLYWDAFLSSTMRLV